MRSCTEALLRPLRQAAVPTEELGLAPLPGVPAFEADGEETFYAALAALLRYHGLPADSPTLMGLSGAAFRLAWRADLLCCPSALFVYGHDPLALLGRALGTQWRRRAGLPLPKALELVRKQLAFGRPVLTCGLLGHAEGSLVVGVSSLEYLPPKWHDEPPIPLVNVTARTPGAAAYEQFQVSTWSGYLPGPGTSRLWAATPLLWLEGLQAPLAHDEAVAAGLAAALAPPPAAGPYVQGLEAYTAWVEMLRADDELAELPELELERQAWGNTFIASRLYAARRAAVRFLRRAAEEVAGRPARRLLAMAAREYEAVSAQLAQVTNLFPAEDEARRDAYADRGVREGAATLLTACRRREKTAHGYLAGALSRLTQ